MKARDIEIKTADLASLLGAEVVGNSELILRGVCPLDLPESEHVAIRRGELTGDSFAQFSGSPLSALVVRDSEYARTSAVPETKSLLLVRDPMLALVALLDHFFEPERRDPGVSKLADIHPTAKLGKDVSIGAFCSLGENVQIGDGTTLHAHVTVYPRVEIGEECELHSGCVLREGVSLGKRVVIQNGVVVGSDGFGYTPHPEKVLVKVPQVGDVQISDDVEIGANTAIDRATMDSTKIGRGSKVDNLAQIGHNVRIGDYSIICGQVGISGSASIGSGVTLAGQVGVGNALHVTDGVRVAAKGGVTKSIDEPGDYSGFPAVPASDFRRQVVALRRLAKK